MGLLLFIIIFIFIPQRCAPPARGARKTNDEERMTEGQYFSLARGVELLVTHRRGSYVPPYGFNSPHGHWHRLPSVVLILIPPKPPGRRS
jgi:hypothetical protein